MTELTKNNFCQFGFNEGTFNARLSPSDSFWVKYSACQRTAYDWRTECILAAHEIYQRAGRDLRICMSGGIDSEIVAESFRFARIPFKVVILRKQPDLNLHDISWAIAYCENFQIPYEFLDLNVHEFLNSQEFFDIGKQANCNYSGIVEQIKLMEMVCLKGLFPVLGAGDLQIKRIENSWRMALNEDYWSLFFYQLQKNYSAVSRFFHWTPELIYSYLNDSVVKSIYLNQQPMLLDYKPLKFEIVKQYFNVQNRRKYFGFEKYQKLNQAQATKLSEMNPKMNSLLYLNVQSVLSQLEPDNTEVIGLRLLEVK